LIMIDICPWSLIDRDSRRMRPGFKDRDANQSVSMMAVLFMLCDNERSR